METETVAIGTRDTMSLVMSATATAVDVVVVFKDGVLKPEGDVRLADALKDSTRYRAHLEPVGVEAAVDDDDPTGWKALDKLIGCIKDAPTDMAENHDFYLYGFPRK